MISKSSLIAVLLCLASATHLPPACAQPGPNKTNPLELPLLHKDNLSYVGAFRVPPQGFAFGGTALGFCAAHNSLFLVGHDHHQQIAEISIPELKTGAIEGLNVATLLQPLTPILHRVNLHTLGGTGTLKVGGLMVIGDKMVGSIFAYYDGNGAAKDSHFTMSSLQLDKAQVSGVFRVGEYGGGLVGGYMTPVPEEWRNRLGSRYLTGIAGLAVISRSSSGPAAFGFDPDLLGERPIPATRYVYYPLKNPLATSNTQNPLYNTTAGITGIVFPDRTRSVLFFGSHGTGPFCYGSGKECNDPVNESKGPHAHPYVYQVWAYDVNDFCAVVDKKKLPWQLRPYDVWQFELPYEVGNKRIGGVAFDPENRLLYVSQLSADRLVQFDSRPIIHAFRIAGDDTPSRPR